MTPLQKRHIQDIRDHVNAVNRILNRQDSGFDTHNVNTLLSQLSQAAIAAAKLYALYEVRMILNLSKRKKDATRK